MRIRVALPRGMPRREKVAATCLHKCENKITRNFGWNLLKLGGRQEGRLAERGKGLSRIPRDTGWGNAFFFLQPSRAELYPWPYRPRVGKTRLGHIRILVFGRAKCRPSIIQQRPFTRLSLPNLSIEPPLRFFFFDLSRCRGIIRGSSKVDQLELYIHVC